jgi:DNA polymerase III epsilon subunit-like protein
MVKPLSKYRVIGLDTETYLENKIMKPFLIQAYSEDFTPKIEEIFEVFKPEEQTRFAKWLISKKIRGSIVVTFNLAFDVSVIAKALNNPKLQVIAIISNGRTIGAKIVKSKHVTRIIDIKNLVNVRSLSELAKMIGMEKLRHPIYLGTKEALKQYINNPHYRNVLREYALQDARICYHAFKKLVNTLQPYYKLSKVKQTIGGLSAYIFGKHYAKYDFPQYPNEIEQKFKLSYRGGRTEVIKRGSNLEKVYYYDINSLYPYVMYSYRYPYNYNNGSGRFVKKNDIDLDYEGIAKVLVRVEHEIPPLGVKRILEDKYERLVFPEGKLLSWFTYPELRYVEENNIGKIEKVYEAFEFRVWCYPFREFVKDLYGYRLQHKEDKFAYKFYKMIMNSLYGKFGEYKSGELVLLTNEGVMKINNEDMNKFRKYHNVVWASYITAYGRLELHKRFKEAGFGSIYYCDTDSLITTSQLQTGEGLGELKLEGYADSYRATFIRSKFYIFDNTIRLRGFVLDVENNDIRELIRKGINYIEQERILKPLEALKRRKPLLLLEMYRKFFNLDTDYKRIYEKLLLGADLLETLSDSQPRYYEEGGLDAVNK